MIRIPRPSYVLSQLLPRQKAGAALCRVLAQLAELYELGDMQACYRAPRSTSLNFIVTTSRGKFLFRQHRLEEEAVAHEYQVLNHLRKRGFPAPRMLVDQAGRAWSTVNGSLYSVYEFMEGYCPASFLWRPAVWREIITQYGRTLGEYHRAVADLVPSAYKWSGYRPAEHRRWCEGEWFRRALADIRPFLQRATATSPVDDFARSRIDAIEKMLELEPVVEGRSDLSKLVIHGDYSPWNIFFRQRSPPFVLDFNESRLDLQIYDVVLATFWFAWRINRLDWDRVVALQTGYCETGQLSEADMSMAGPVFQWIMARSLIERLYTHYLGIRPKKESAGLEAQYQMCLFAGQQPWQLVAGLRGGCTG